MIKIDLKIDQGIPQYSCNSCGNCQSVFGVSLCNIKNRGCCWYFPKFTLYDIHKMVKDEEGLKTLNSIRNLPDVEIYNYYIHAKGYFDEKSYIKYIESEQEDTNVQDKTIFFRACPFVKSAKGCTLPKRYRSYVCNFFICNEIISKIEKNDEFKNYIKERDSYVRWLEWENYSLEMVLREKRINLVNNFDKVINILKGIELRECKLRNLDSIVVNE
ncbi:hypothetical protein [Clostridium cibarium]|uniref:YkgJ family cysteine cluster protein n=1 Tax=Clostridium cibarium TaxID=2762247 RepID=A0ABR8PWL5_9CLOT|nr:hypothetical protein [Clostridium cibarium]MBD7912583.1 hypothetical protein [Clostridium cibarium]